jgi:hypothetical protein
VRRSGISNDAVAAAPRRGQMFLAVAHTRRERHGLRDVIDRVKKATPVRRGEQPACPVGTVSTAVYPVKDSPDSARQPEPRWCMIFEDPDATTPVARYNAVHLIASMFAATWGGPDKSLPPWT